MDVYKNGKSEIWNLFFSYGTCDPGPKHTPVIVIGVVACGSFLLTVVVGIIFVCVYRRKIRPQGRFDGKGHQMNDSKSTNLFFTH